MVPVVGALFWKGGTEQGAWASFVVGIGYIVLSALGIINLPYHYIVGVSPAFIVYVAVSLATRKHPNELTS
jgi:SSS family solute:Na+ symporter